jgi:hypothetical protein
MIMSSPSDVNDNLLCNINIIIIIHWYRGYGV